MQEKKDWEQWHSQYDVKGTDLSKRLVIVQNAIKKSLPEHLEKTFTIIDICSGDGRDISDALKNYPHGDMIRGLLTEINQNLAAKAKSYLQGNGLENLDVVVADAADTSIYSEYVPADLVLLCGVFGNINDEDIENTIKNLSSLCSHNATVIWTRNRREPDATPKIRELFQENGFQEDDFIAPDGNTYAVGVNKFSGEYRPAQEHRRLFTFIR